MAETVADHRQGNVAVAGRRSPGVPRHVHAQRLLGSGHLPHGLEVPVDLMAREDVLPALVGMRVGDYGQQVAGLRPQGIFVEQLLHAGLPAHAEQLSGLAPTVFEHAVAEVAAAQVGHVHEGHAAGVEGEQEHVAREIERGALDEGEPADTAEQRHGNRPFPGSAYAGVDGPEGIFLLRESAVDRPVVDSAQYAHVEGCGVGAEAACAQIGLIGGEQRRRHCVQRKVRSVPETAEAAQRRLNLTPATNGQ